MLLGPVTGHYTRRPRTHTTVTSTWGEAKAEVATSTVAPRRVGALSIGSAQAMAASRQMPSPAERSSPTCAQEGQDRILDAVPARGAITSPVA